MRNLLKRRRIVAEPPPWIIEELKQQKQEHLRENNQPRVELPLPELPPDETEEEPIERVVEL